MLALRRAWRSALPWVAFVVAVWLFMGGQERFYARWFLPVYPVLAVFAAYALVAIATAFPARRALVGVALAAAVFAQPLVTVVHSDVILNRADTRLLAKRWLLSHVGRGTKLAFELVGPGPYFNDGDRRDGASLFDLYPQPRGADIERYATTLSPATVDAYVDGGYCFVVTGSIISQRALKDPSAAEGAIAYYRALASRATRVATFSPVRRGATVPGFNFDLSYNWYPLTYVRPGPRIDVYHLHSGACAT